MFHKGKKVIQVDEISASNEQFWLQNFLILGELTPLILSTLHYRNMGIYKSIFDPLIKTVEDEAGISVVHVAQQHRQERAEWYKVKHSSAIIRKPRAQTI